MGGPGSGPRPGQRNRAGTGKTAKVGIRKDVRGGKLGENRKYTTSRVSFHTKQTGSKFGLYTKRPSKINSLSARGKKVRR